MPDSSSVASGLCCVAIAILFSVSGGGLTFRTSIVHQFTISLLGLQGRLYTQFRLQKPSQGLVLFFNGPAMALGRLGPHHQTVNVLAKGIFTQDPLGQIN